jgi:hypothetical protein
MKVSLFIQPKPLPIPATSKAPCGWADINVGSLVLASDGPGEGWWERTERAAP